MAAAGLEGIPVPRKTRTTVRVAGVRCAPDLVERDFNASAPNRLWCADITYLPTWEGWLYLASVLDCFSRLIVGWCMLPTLRLELVERALEMAVARRRPAPGLIHHSDHGSQGEFRRSSQHLDREELRWASRSGGGRIGLVGRRCGRRAGRRGGAGSIGSGSGQRSLAARRARPLVWRPVSRRRLVSDGSGMVAGCRRSPWRRCRGVTCRSRSGRRSLCCALAGVGFGRSRASSAARRRRCPGSCAGTPRPVVVVSSTERQLRSGMRIGGRAVRSRPSWR